MLKLNTLLTTLICSFCFSQAITAQEKKPKKGDEKIVEAPAPAKPAADTTKPKKPVKPSITDKIKTSKKLEGLFTMYQDTVTGSIQLYVKKSQIDKEYIYQSFSISGPTSLFLNQSMHRATAIFNIKKANDKIEFGEVNTSFYYDKNNAISKTAGVDVPEAVFLSEKLVAQDSLGYLIAADGLFLSEKLDPVKPTPAPGTPPGAIFNLGNLNAAKSKYHSIRSFPNNTDVVVDLSYDNPAPLNGGGDDITDARYVRVRMQHTFLEVPQNNFKPRIDDPRIGYFGQQVTNQTSIKPTPYRDLINKWYLTKKDPKAEISEPVEPVTYWVENTTPVEYRQIIMDAGHRWNEAFEKAGFKNAIVMKIQSDTATWDPADVRYNVIRWVASANPGYGAIGPSFANPRTGQILGADITVEWISGSSTPIIEDLFTFNGQLNNSFIDSKFHHEGHACTLAGELKSQFLTGTTFAEVNNASADDLKRIHKDFLFYLILHEMGHTLGLHHNMKSSQMLKPSELHNTEITHKIGLTGSVMDYPAVNISSDRSKQGDYYTTKPGPYDLWAIEFGYKEFDEKEEAEGLKKILSRSKEPYLAFGNDADDMRAPGKAIDPRVNVNDLSSDAISHAEDRLKLVNTVMNKLKTKYSKSGENYAELRSRFGNLNNQRMSMTSALSRYIGGVMVERNYVGDQAKANEKPFTPISMAEQKRALAVLNKYIFAPDAFKNDAGVYPYLQLQRRGFNLFSSPEDPKLNATYLSLQINGALAHILHPNTLLRLSNSSLYGNEYSVASVMGDLTKGIFNADIAGKVNVQRQFLQTAFVKQLGAIADLKTPANAYDDISKGAARQSLKKIKSMVSGAVSGDDATKSHRANLVALVDKSLAIN
ncbi:MAG: zinc-dependent metalloprotease [Bacteroidota bacterium]